MHSRSRVEGRAKWVALALVALVVGCAAEKGGRAAAAEAEGRAAADPGTTSPPSSERKRILFVGTSLTAGLGLADPDSAYPQLIQQKLDSAGLAYEVENAGVSGETSAALLQRIDWLLRDEFDVIVIETGANDGLRGIPVSAMRSNIREIVARVQRTHPKARVVLAQMEAPPNMGARYTAEFRETFPLIAKETGVALLPFLLDGVAGSRELNQADGIHPNMAGERVVAENVWKGLQPVLQE